MEFWLHHKGRHCHHLPFLCGLRLSCNADTQVHFVYIDECTHNYVDGVADEEEEDPVDKRDAEAEGDIATAIRKDDGDNNNRMLDGWIRGHDSQTPHSMGLDFQFLH